MIGCNADTAACTASKAGSLVRMRGSAPAATDSSISTPDSRSLRSPADAAPEMLAVDHARAARARAATSSGSKLMAGSVVSLGSMR